jgi:hypothetical protein
MNKALLLALNLAFFVAPASAQSVFLTRPDDPRAIYVTPPDNEQSDDTALLQAAIDKAAGTGREGIVFVPSSRYRLTRTLYLWPGVRIFGYGATRPVFTLPDNTPGFQTGVAVMVIFTGVNPKDPTVSHSRIPFPPPAAFHQLTRLPMRIPAPSTRQ